MQQKELRLNFISPTVHSDAANISISTEGDIPTLNFLQVRSEDDEHVHADVAASVRMASLAELEGLVETIKTVIAEHKNREP